jgi:hypothetical protein
MLKDEIKMVGNLSRRDGRYTVMKEAQIVCAGSCLRSEAASPALTRKPNRVPFKWLSCLIL